MVRVLSKKTLRKYTVGQLEKRHKNLSREFAKLYERAYKPENLQNKGFMKKLSKIRMEAFKTMDAMITVRERKATVKRTVKRIRSRVKRRRG